VRVFPAIGTSDTRFRVRPGTLLQPINGQRSRVRSEEVESPAGVCALVAAQLALG
jgi:hypothetical protein